VTRVGAQGMCMDYATRDWTVSGFGPQNPGAVLVGFGGSTWRHCEACVEAKQSGERRVAIGLTEIELDHNALRLCGSLYLLRGSLGICNSPNKR